MTNDVDASDALSAIPYRMAFAGGWIDQPFVSELNPDPPGSMVVVAIDSTRPYMDRCGMATSTRKVIAELWGRIPSERDPADLVREIYEEENRGRTEPSGSQDMIGLIYPGVNRLDYRADHEGGILPCHIESNNDPEVARWLERVIHMVPIAERPEGYSPLTRKNLDSEWIRRLGQSGKDCFDAIGGRDAQKLGASMNECMECWEAILPDTVTHESLQVDLKAALWDYQSKYPGAMYSGCGGGYLYVVSEEPVPGALNVKVRNERGES
jgi:hypothetical protein